MVENTGSEGNIDQERLITLRKHQDALIIAERSGNKKDVFFQRNKIARLHLSMETILPRY